MFFENFYRLCEQNHTKPIPVVKLLGIATGSVTKWKEGSVPNGETLLKIANHFNCSVDYLLGREKADAEEISAEENVIIYHRDGKTVKKKMSKEKMELLATMLEALPDDGEL